MEIIALLFACLLIYFAVENIFMLRVRREKLSDNGDIRIIHLSDLHKRTFGKDNKRLLEKTEKENPDLIIFSGDAITRDCRDFSELERFLCRLVKIAPVL
jgi:predicted MPP superfamily phosphohydrolase